jgi:hypothetical protein
MPRMLWKELESVKTFVVIGMGDGEVSVPMLRGDGSLSLDGVVVECLSCSGLWFANPIDEQAHHCQHCGDKQGGLASLMANASIRESGVKTCWIGTHNPVAYRKHIDTFAA